MTARDPSALAFFWTVQRPSLTILAAGVAVASLGMYMAVAFPGDTSTVDTAMALALVLQMFVASSGFRQRGLRGHFDALLAARPSRWRVAAAHFVVSAAPGFALWVFVIALAYWVRPGAWPAPATPSALLAVVLVSTLAWAVSLPTAQYAAGSLWILVLLFLGVTHRLAALRHVFYLSGSAASVGAARAAILCPLLLLSEAPAVRRAVVELVLAASVAAGVLGALYIVRFDGRLVEVD